MAALVLVGDSSVPQAFPITSARWVLGRGTECELHQVLLESKGVSRQHAVILKIDDQYYLEDLQSRNGTTLNGQRISARQLLKEGDRIGISGLVFRFQHQMPGSVAALAAKPKSRHVDLSEAGSAPQLLALVPLPSGGTAEAAVTNAQRKLQAILGLLNRLGQSLDVNEVLNHLLEGLLQVFPKADQAFAGLFAEDRKMSPTAFRERTESETEMRISRTIIEHVTNSKSAVLSAHLESDARFEKSASIRDMKCESLMCAPLIDAEGQVFGIIQLGRLSMTSRRRVFDEEDLEVLASVAVQAGITLRYAKEHAQAMHRQAFDLDMKLARRVQLGILPSEPPEVDLYQFFNYYEAAFEVGGDYYDYVPLSESRMAVVVADASGKGVSAALLMAKVAGELRYFLSSQPTLGAAVARMNESLCAASVTGRFVTLVVAVLDPIGHEVVVVNAGHMPPLLRLPDGSVQPVQQSKRSAAIGLFSGQVYEEVRVPLLPGASMVLYTDGFSEAENPRAELYGTERLIRRMRSGIADVAELGRVIVEDVQRFIEGHSQSDDMCLVCFGRQP